MVAIKTLLSGLALGLILFLTSTVSAHVAEERVSIDALTGDAVFEHRTPLLVNGEVVANDRANEDRGKTEVLTEHTTLGPVEMRELDHGRDLCCVKKAHAGGNVHWDLGSRCQYPALQTAGCCCKDGGPVKNCANPIHCYCKNADPSQGCVPHLLDSRASTEHFNTQAEVHGVEERIESDVANERGKIDTIDERLKTDLVEERAITGSVDERTQTTNERIKIDDWEDRAEIGIVEERAAAGDIKEPSSSAIKCCVYQTSTGLDWSPSYGPRTLETAGCCCKNGGPGPNCVHPAHCRCLHAKPNPGPCL